MPDRSAVPTGILVRISIENVVQLAVQIDTASFPSGMKGRRRLTRRKEIPTAGHGDVR
jgi:hypothetical protein